MHVLCIISITCNNDGNFSVPKNKSSLLVILFEYSFWNLDAKRCDVMKLMLNQWIKASDLKDLNPFYPQFFRSDLTDMLHSKWKISNQNHLRRDPKYSARL